MRRLQAQRQRSRQKSGLRSKLGVRTWSTTAEGLTPLLRGVARAGGGARYGGGAGKAELGVAG